MSEVFHVYASQGRVNYAELDLPASDYEMLEPGQLDRGGAFLHFFSCHPLKRRHLLNGCKSCQLPRQGVELINIRQLGEAFVQIVPLTGGGKQSEVIQLRLPAPQAQIQDALQRLGKQDWKDVAASIQDWSPRPSHR